MRAGADGYIASTDAAQMAEHTGVFDLILNTVPSNHDTSIYTNLLTPNGGKQVHIGLTRQRSRPGCPTSSCLAVRMSA